MGGTYFYVSMFFYPQGLTLVRRCPSARMPGSRRRERRCAKVGPGMETTQP